MQCTNKDCVRSPVETVGHALERGCEGVQTHRAVSGRQAVQGLAVDFSENLPGTCLHQRLSSFLTKALEMCDSSQATSTMMSSLISSHQG